MNSSFKYSLLPTTNEEFGEEKIVPYLAALKNTTSGIPIPSILGEEVESWKVTQELSGGNINHLYLVQGSSQEHKLLVKWAPPYIKIVTSWKLHPKRCQFEIDTMLIQSKLLSDSSSIPTIYHHDKQNALIVMEFLGDCIVLKQALMSRTKFSTDTVAAGQEEEEEEETTKGSGASEVSASLMAKKLGNYLAETLFKTSDLYLGIEDKMNLMSYYAMNGQIVGITLQVIFYEPFVTGCKNNSWTQVPEMNEAVKQMQENQALKKKALDLTLKFRSHTEALVHGDLHTGSVMVNPESGRTAIIDSEFAFFGPIGFDVGLLLANFIISYFSQQGMSSSFHKTKPEIQESETQLYQQWIQAQIRHIWEQFKRRFTELWDDRVSSKADPLHLQELLPQQASLKDYQEEYLQRIFQDTMGFAALEMIRRMVGLASCPDMDQLQDEMARARCEIRTIKMGSEMLHGNVHSISQLLTSMTMLNKH